MPLNSLTALQFPPFSSELFSLPTSTPSGLWGKLLMKGWKSHFFKEVLCEQNRTQTYFAFADKIHASFVLQTYANSPIAIVFCMKACRLAFVTPGLYSAAQRNQAWFPHCVLYSHFRKQAEILRVWVIPPPCSLLENGHWCPESCLTLLSILTSWLLLKVTCFLWQHCSEIYSF